MSPEGRQARALAHARSQGVDKGMDGVLVAAGVEVDTSGDLACLPGAAAPHPAPGGSADVVVVTSHLAADGTSALVDACTMPVLLRGCVATVVTDLAVVDVSGSTFVLRRTAPGVSASDVVRATAGPIDILSYLRTASARRTIDVGRR